ncbi:uncharacterized protein N7446_010195 [Penicillium canescens]|uniref:uncharacterized protein n=1 Tax=Penicillium canescens TaxID=5083 RepID=UPI0026E0FC4A|nr:uncharacterized protein N7446_010195 [Penicillium canescens]KAJ6054183.1 hypothetical protein N7446_010195 [Penicillium canescens]
MYLFKQKNKKTYNSKDSLVVTHLTTNLPACGLSTAERTGSPVLHTLWSYVLVIALKGTITTKALLIRPRYFVQCGAYVRWKAEAGARYAFQRISCPEVQQYAQKHTR